VARRPRLIVESEHGPDPSAFLVTPSRAVAEAAIAAIPQHWTRMGRARGLFQRRARGPRGGVLLTPDIQSAYDFVNDYAPEHLVSWARSPSSI
jgi:histidinol dehydrogenase